MEEARERIKELVRKSGVAANSFGKIVGIDPSNFSRKMRGEQSITRKDIDKISSAIGVSKAWLLNGSGKSTSRKRQVIKSELVLACHTMMLTSPLGLAICLVRNILPRSDIYPFLDMRRQTCGFAQVEMP